MLNLNKVYTVMGASSHSKEEREINDYYATTPKAIDVLLDETGILFNPYILEPACGEGHLSKRLVERGYKVKSSDLINRGYGEIQNFFKIDTWKGDIITNPPYKLAQEFVEHSLKIVFSKAKVAMFLKLTFLEGRKRKKMFKKYPPKYIFVSSSRLQCSKNGMFDTYKNTAIAYGWYIWEKGYTGNTVVRWVN